MGKQKQSTKSFSFIAILLALVFFSPSLVHAIQCKGELYDNLAFLEPKESFSIREKVYIKISCDALPEADLNISVSWYNMLGEMFRSDSQDIASQKGDSRMIYFWIKLHRKGKLSSAYTDKLYSDKSYGQWTVKSYITNKNDNNLIKIVSKQFTLK